MRLIRSFGLVVTVGALLAMPQPVEALGITLNTVLGIDYANLQQPFPLREYSTSGVVNETLGTSGFAQTPVGLALLGGTLYAMDVAGGVGSINLTTGALTPLFDTGGNEALGDDGTNLLSYNFGSGTMTRYTPAGAVVSSVALAPGGTGIDGDGSRIFLANYLTGAIQVFNPAGTLLQTIATGLPGSSLSGLAYDAGTDTVWVSTGFGDDRIRQYDFSGNLLTNFAAPGNVNGLEFVGESVGSVPEPASLLLLGTGLIGAGMRRYRQGRGRQ